MSVSTLCIVLPWNRRVGFRLDFIYRKDVECCDMFIAQTSSHYLLESTDTVRISLSASLHLDSALIFLPNLIKLCQIGWRTNFRATDLIELNLYSTFVSKELYRSIKT